MTVQSATATPTGQVSFAGPNATAGSSTGAALSFTPSTCVLGAAGADSASCTVSVPSPGAGCYAVIGTYSGDGPDNPTAEAASSDLIVDPVRPNTYTEGPSCSQTPAYADRATADAPTFQAACVTAPRGTVCGAEFSDGLYIAPTGTASVTITSTGSVASSRVSAGRASRQTSVLSGSCALTTPVNSGTLAACSTTLATLPAGEYAYTISYSGDSLYASRSVSGSLDQAAPASTTTVQPRVAVALTGAGTGGVTSSPAGIDCPGSCTGSFAKGALVTLNAVAAPGSAFAGFFGGGCDGPRPCSVTASEAPTVRAEFVKDTAAPPVNGISVNVALVSGTIRVQGPNGGPFTTLRAGDSIPVGATVDARDGTVLLTSAAAGNRTDQSAIFREGEFVIAQSPGAKLTRLTLTGGSTRACHAPVPSVLGGGADARHHQPHKRVRHLWGSGKGSFQTDGAYASATVRGTIWRTTDFCDGTAVTVIQGLIAVRDFVTQRTIRVPAGKYFFASAP